MQNRRTIIMLAAKLVIASLVLAGIAVFVRNAWSEFSDGEFDLRRLQPGWLAVAAITYAAGLIPFWLFWHRVLSPLGQRPRLSESARAHLIGHLGKYVPGKAMVVVLRTGLVRSDRTRATAAATAVFIETLTMMAVGAFMAAACLLPAVGEVPGLVALAIALMLAAGIPTWPPIFRRIVRMLQLRRADPEIDRNLDGLNLLTMAFGWIALSVGWSLFGVSLWATLQAMPGVAPPIADLPRLIGCVALAVVAGFVSLIPAGLGVRELVMLPLLGRYGEAAALVATVVTRLMWLLSELILSSILYLWARLSSHH